MTTTSATPAKSRKLLLGVAISVAFIASVTSAFAGLGSDPWAEKGRYTVLVAFASQAVLDNETGLVWEKSPSAGAFTWAQAHARCNALVVGARMGWRLPTLQELTSLLDIGQPNNLTPGHPFVVLPPWNVGEHIWSATTSASNTGNAWTMWLAGNVSNTDPKGSLSHAWCVRFRQGVEAQ